MLETADDRTWTSAEAAAPAETTRTRTTSDLVQEAGHLRNTVRLVSNDVSEIHHRALAADLESRARAIVRQASAQDMLEALADEGFSWRGIAALVGVSVPALRRWRQGDPPTPGHLLDIARVLALVHTLESEPLITDAARWLEIPLDPEVPITGLELAAAGAYELILDYATDQLSAEEVLDRWRPDWRTAYRSEFEVFEAPDGELGIRLASPEQ